MVGIITQLQKLKAITQDIITTSILSEWIAEYSSI